MRTNRLLVPIAAMFVIAFALSARADVKFRSVTFEEAKKLAVKEKKKIMVDFFTDWCIWCKRLDKQTYTDSAVTVLTNASFVSVKIDAEKGEGIVLAKKYEIKGFPTIMFFDGNGAVVDRVVGYQDGKAFYRSLTVAKDGGTQAMIEKLKTPKGEKDAKLWLIAGNYYAQHDKQDDALKAYDKVMTLDVSDALGAREEAMYARGFLLTGKDQRRMLEQATMQYPKREEARQAYMVLIKSTLADTIHSVEVVQYLDGWIADHPNDADFLNDFAWAAAERGVQLPRAEECITRAIDMAPDPTSRAEMMDTKAEICSKLPGRLADAVVIEQQAIEFLGPDPMENTKLRANLTEQLEKFKKMVAADNGNSGAPSDVVVAPIRTN